MSIRVAHVKEFTKGGKVALPENAVYVGRRVNRYGLKASPLANLYPISRNRTREEAILTFRAWLHVVREIAACRIATPQVVAAMDELVRLLALHERHGELILLCWCAPQACHADVIKEALEAEGA